MILWGEVESMGGSIANLDDYYSWTILGPLVASASEIPFLTGRVSLFISAPRKKCNLFAYRGLCAIY